MNKGTEMLYTHFRNYGCRINTDYFYKDLRVAILENEYLKISILIDKGTDIFEFLYKPKDTDFMWLSPWGIRSPSNFVTTISSKEGNFMDYYEGGWQEIIPNFGVSVQSQGTEQGLHGEISLAGNFLLATNGWGLDLLVNFRKIAYVEELFLSGDKV